jgi:hypothetical protein
MLRLRAGTATLLIGPRSAAGMHGGRYCLDSETDIRQRLTLALQDPASGEAMRRFWAHWQSDARLAGVKDHSIVDRIARMSVRGPLIVILVVDTSVHRRDTSASRSKQVAEALQNQNQFKPWSGPVKPPALVTVSTVMPVAAKAPAPVDRSIIGSPQKLVGDWTIAEKLTSIVMRAADSRKLSLDTQQQLKGMLSDPKFVAWLVGSLLVWFVAQFFVVGEIFDMLLAGAALVLSGAGIFFALQSLVGAAHLIGQFVDATRSAKDEKDLDAAADILAEIIVMIGITVLIAALTHATTPATSEGQRVSTVKKPPPERTPPVERLQERPGSKTSAQRGSRASAPTDASRMRARVLANISESQVARQSSNFSAFAAKEAQITGGYSADDFEMVTIPKGSIVYGGNPMSSWFTDEATLQSSGASQQSLWDSLQVRPNPTFGPRTSVTAYEVLEDIRVPAGQALNNPDFGGGGGSQFYLNQANAPSVLRPVNTVELH